MRKRPACRRRRLILLAAVFLLVGLGGAGRAQAQEDQVLTAVRGVPGRPVQYRLMVTNGDTSGHTYDLKVNGLPSGSAVFLRDGASVLRVTLKPGATADLTLRVTPPVDSGTRQYFFSALAAREDGPQKVLPLALQVDAAGVLRIAGAISQLSALSGQETEFPVTVVNQGAATAQTVRLSTALPPKWQARVRPATVAALGPGESAEFRVKLMIPPTQDAGNQQVQVAAESGGVATASMSVRVVVQKGTGNLLLPAILVVVSVLGTMVYFRRHGRR